MADTTPPRPADRSDAPPLVRRDEPGRSDLSAIARLLSGQTPDGPITPTGKSRR